MYQDREEGLYHPAFLSNDFFFIIISLPVLNTSSLSMLLKIDIEFPTSQFHGIIKG